MQPNLPNKVFILDTNKHPLNLISPKQARKLLDKGKAAVYRQFPFTIILKSTVDNPTTYPLTLKIDPGSKHTGLAILSEDVVIWVAQIQHRGQLIKDSLISRSQLRRGRRSRKTRYRAPRFNNRKRSQGWLPPSLMHRVQTTETWVKRLIKFCPIKVIEIERVKFDTQLMQYDSIFGTDYQQGTLQGYTVREYLLEKWGRECAYCGAKDKPLQVEHIIPKSKGGSNRPSNLTLACKCCNQAKGSRPVEEFLKGKPKKLALIKSQAKTPLKDSAAVNSTRNKIVKVLSKWLPVSTSSGAQTKFNRCRLDLPKDHHIDAACIGDVDNIYFEATQPLMIKCTGKGTRQRVNPDKYGFPKSYKHKNPVFFGFRTGDIVRAVVTKGKYPGEHFGRIAVRQTGSFKIYADRVINHINHRYCFTVHKADGYSYSY